MKIRCLIALTAACLVAGPVGAESDQPQGNRLAKARKLVDSSDRYLHHSQLKRGMKGHGLTVLAGMKIVRFDAEILSLLKGQSAGRDMILAKLSGPGEKNFLSVSGIIAGMSGSPVYMTDPADGKSKMIGAVAYGWFAQKEPICGIQPITQMIAASKLIDPPGKKQAPARAAKPASTLTAEQFAKLLHMTSKPDILAEVAKLRSTKPKRHQNIQPLKLPLALGSAHSDTIARLDRRLGPLGLRPVQTPAAGKAPKGVSTKLQPGSAISVHLVTGDMDWAAVGTVTEVVGDTVLAFGHSFLGQGAVDFPIGPAYVHTVISNFESFKMASPTGTSGALQRDESVAVSGQIGATARMVPLTVTLHAKPAGREQTFKYQIAQDRRFLPMFMASVVQESVLAWTELPERHHVSYHIEATYPQLGQVQIENAYSDSGVWPLRSDLTLLLFSLADNPIAKPLFPESVAVEVTVTDHSRGARLEHVQLDSQSWKPGQKITGKATFSRFRQADLVETFAFQLPDDVEPGKHELKLGDLGLYLSYVSEAEPGLFDPRSSAEILRVVKTITAPQADRLYMVLPKTGQGLSVAGKVLKNLPPSRAEMMQQANLPRSQKTSAFVGQNQKLDYNVSGRATVEFTVIQPGGDAQLRAERNNP